VTDAAARDAIIARLRAAGCVFAEEEADLLIEAGAHEQQIARRVDGEPLEVILGWAAFRGLRIPVEPGVFVPRQRSGILVDQARALAPPGSVVVELCAGAGAVAAALAAERPDLEVYAAELDPAAVRVAARTLGADRVFAGDLFAALPRALAGRIGVVVANAPYVPTAEIANMPPEAREHEPLMALDGGADGLDVQRRVVAGAREWLSPGGALIVETSVRQAPASVELMRAAGFDARWVHDDELDGTAAVGVARV
jgi:release factor glutamine methyltransferase